MFPLEILRAGIKLADKLTKGVQQDVTVEAWIGQSAFGDPSYDSPVVLQGVVDLTRRQMREVGGTMVNVVATITFVGDVAPNGSSTVPPRYEPIDPKDKVTLVDGTTGPVIIGAPDSVVDPGTGRGLVHIIGLGASA